jgi:hypothetical protein
MKSENDAQFQRGGRPVRVSKAPQLNQRRVPVAA